MNLDFSKLKQLNIDGVVLNSLYVGQYHNLILNAIDADGTYYNGCGFMRGYRLSSSGALKEQANSIVSGFMPCTATSVVKMTGAAWLEVVNQNTDYNYLSYYDDEFNLLAAINYNGNLHIHGSIEIDLEKSVISVDDSDCTTFQIAFIEGADTSEIAYFRINAIDNGANMVVVVDEDITDSICIWKKVVNYTNQVPISTDTDGSIFNGVGYKENVRLSSSGGISSSAQNGSVTTGFIPWYGDTTYLRMKGVNWVNVYDIVSSGHYYIIPYDANKEPMGGYISVSEYSGGTLDHIVSITRDANGVETVKFSETYGTTNTYLQAFRNAKYIRINAYGKGASMIVTINEEIT